MSTTGAAPVRVPPPILHNKYHISAFQGIFYIGPAFFRSLSADLRIPPAQSFRQLCPRFAASHRHWPGKEPGHRWPYDKINTL